MASALASLITIDIFAGTVFDAWAYLDYSFIRPPVHMPEKA